MGIIKGYNFMNDRFKKFNIDKLNNLHNNLYLTAPFVYKYKI